MQINNYITSDSNIYIKKSRSKNKNTGLYLIFEDVVPSAKLINGGRSLFSSLLLHKHADGVLCGSKGGGK